MNVIPTGVTNAANLSLCMVNVAYHLQAEVCQRDPDYGILDLKADCRGYTYVEETINMLPEKPEPVLLGQILHKGYVQDTCLCLKRHKHVYPAHQIMPRSSLARVVHPWKHTVARLPYAP
jgi:hypothetical protein